MTERYNIRSADGSKVGSVERDYTAEAIATLAITGFAALFGTSTSVVAFGSSPPGAATPVFAMVEQRKNAVTSHLVSLLEPGGIAETIKLPAMGTFYTDSLSPQAHYYAALGIHQQFLTLFVGIDLIDTRAARVVGQIKLPHQGLRGTKGVTNGPALCFSPDTKYLYSVYRGHIYRFDIPSGHATTLLESQHPLAGLAVSPDGQAAVTLEAQISTRLTKTLAMLCPKLIDTTSGRSLLVPPPTASQEVVLESRRNVFVLDFAPDGKQVAFSSLGNQITIWDLRTNQANVLPPQAGQTRVVGLAYSPTGAYLAAGYEDGIVRLWDTSTWQLRAKLCQHGTEGVPVAPCGLRWLDERTVISLDLTGDIKATTIPGARPTTDAATIAPSAHSADEILAALKQLGSLRDAGILTEVEFNQKKAQLLGRL